MKKIILACALLVGAVSFSNVQAQGFQQPPPEERAQAALDGQVLASFNLTAEQKQKTKDLLVKTYKSTDSLMAAANGDFQSVMPKRATITEANEKIFLSWLTADQKKAYETALAAAKERNPAATTVVFGGRGGGRGGAGGGAPRPPGQ